MSYYDDHPLPTSWEEYERVRPGHLTDEEIIRLNETASHFSDRPMLPKLSPSQILDERTITLEALRTPQATAIFEGLLKSIRSPGSRDSTTLGSNWTARDLQAQTAARLAGEVFYVEDAMTRMAYYAGLELPDEPTFTRDLFPAPIGYIRLEQPYRTIDVRGQSLGLAAMGWGPMVVVDPQGKQQNGVYVVEYSHLDDMGDDINRELVALWGGEDVRKMHVGAKLAWTHSMAIPFDQPARGHYKGSAAHLLWALLRLMQQEIGTTSRAALDRHAVKRARRKRFPDEVHVVRLRRPRYIEADSETPHFGRDWTCRWFVGFHWRHYDRATPMAPHGIQCTRHGRICYLAPIAPYMKNTDRDDLPIRDPSRKLTVLSR